ncbi:MAG: transcription termination/antitermination NusG family protein [Anaerolineaceae bacterium]
MFRWYVMQSKPRKEYLLWNQLTQRRVETFFPRFSPNQSKNQTNSKVPYFPGYLFIHVDFDLLDQSALQWLPGSVGIVKFGGEPGIVPEELIRNLEAHIHKESISPDQDTPQFQSGDPVLVQNSYLNGYPAIFDSYLSGGARVRVLLTLMQNEQRKIELPAEQIYRKLD